MEDWEIQRPAVGGQNPLPLVRLTLKQRRLQLMRPAGGGGGHRARPAGVRAGESNRRDRGYGTVRPDQGGVRRRTRQGGETCGRGQGACGDTGASDGSGRLRPAQSGPRHVRSTYRDSTGEFSRGAKALRLGLKSSGSSETFPRSIPAGNSFFGTTGQDSGGGRGSRRGRLRGDDLRARQARLDGSL